MKSIQRKAEISRVRQKIHDGKVSFYLEDVRILDAEIRRLERKLQWERTVGRVRSSPWSKIKARGIPR